MKGGIGEVARRWLAVTVLVLSGLPGSAGAQTSGQVVEDFSAETIGAEPRTFTPQAGFWSVAADDNRPVLLEDGSHWEGSALASGLAAQARTLYGERWNEFIDDLAAAAYFPLAEFNKVENFTVGTLSVRFKVLGGTFDQDCGLVFNVRENGDFLALKSDTLENNLVLYQSLQGQVVSLQRVVTVATSPGDWHEQKLVANGTHITGLIDGQVRVEADLDAPPTGGVGVFAKRDTVVMFSDFAVDPGATAVPVTARPPAAVAVKVPTRNLEEAIDWARKGELPRARGELQEFLADWDSVEGAVRQRSPEAADAIAVAVADARQLLLNADTPAPDQARFSPVLERLQQTIHEQEGRLG